MDRRQFVAALGAAFAARAMTSSGEVQATSTPGATSHDAGPVTLFLAGDVMLGRGIDQVLPHSVDPRLHESYVKDARRYVALAEAEHGEIPAPVPFDYVWGDALAELDRMDPDARIINLETAVTTSDSPWAHKGIHYRMHPENTPVLTAAGIDVCVLGNNHVMDWGRAGLRETLEALSAAGLPTAGAGESARAAAAPAVVETGKGRLLVFSYGTPTAGVPTDWAAAGEAGGGEADGGEGDGEGARAGVNLLPTLDREAADRVIEDVESRREDGDRVVVSIHWGGNWGYDVPAAQRWFAHRLIDAGAADVVHGHSSHHPKGIEVHGGRLILYGAGDFLNDYEGIGGREEYRGGLTVMYFPTLAPSGELVELRMAPMRIRRFRLERAPEEDAEWLAERLDEHSRVLGTRVAPPAPGPAPGPRFGFSVFRE
ncbi:MAG: CapA family protein [Longimicrobiales bacterium]